MTESERIIDKVRKLQAHADSAAEIGSEEEAQAFAAKVQELLTAYKLSAHDVGRPDAPKEDINTTYFGWTDIGLKVRNVRVGWAERLARNVAHAYYCEFVISSYGGRIGFYVGRETDREVAVFMFITLARFLDKIANKEGKLHHLQQWKAAGSPANWSLPEHLSGFRAGFRMGFINRLWERFEDEVRPKVDPAANTHTQAIVLLRRDALAKAKDWMKDNLTLHRCSSVGLGDTSNADGQARGRAAADDVNLRPNVISGTKKSSGQLKGGS